MTAATTGDDRTGGPGDAPRRTPTSALAAWWRGPLLSFHLVVAVTVLLSVSGLAMVLSASSVESISVGGSAFSMFRSQLMYTVVGAVLFIGALTVPIRTLRRLSPGLVLVSIALLFLVLVPGIGRAGPDGARRWVGFGPVSLQPSELMKLALVVWGAHILVRGRTRPGVIGDPRWHLTAVAVLTGVLVMLQPNLSTTIALGIIVVTLLWFTGLQGRWFIVLLLGGGAVAVLAALTSDYRAKRIMSFLSPGEDPMADGYQARQARYSLADGGFFGRGPGESRAKWDYLPNAHNDFIFAIIGEELGLIGALGVLALFALFAYVGMRIARRSVDPYLRLFAVTVTVWTIAQSFINIGYVIGLLPVTGLQLPLISAGGSSTMITLAAFGLLANAARHEPEAVSALRAARDGRPRRRFRLPLPAPYDPRRDPFSARSGPRRPGPHRPAPTGRQAPPRRRPESAGRAPRGDRRHRPGGPAGARGHDGRYRGRSEVQPPRRTSRTEPGRGGGRGQPPRSGGSNERKRRQW